MIEVKQLFKAFGDKEVLKNITTTFEEGKTNLIIGQSGSGKTVFMKNFWVFALKSHPFLSSRQIR